MDPGQENQNPAGNQNPTPPIEQLPQRLIIHGMEELIVQQQQILRHQSTHKDKSSTRHQNQDKRDWVKDNSSLIGTCAGGSTRDVREYIRQLKAARKRVPINDINRIQVNADQAILNRERAYMHALIEATARGEVYEEYEVCLNGHPGGRDATPVDDIMQHLLDAFLGPDECEALKDEIKKTKQGGREEIPAFNRRFKKAASLAFPTPTDADQSYLVKKYLKNLRKGRIQDRLFELDDDLEDLPSVMAAAQRLWGQHKFRNRVIEDHDTRVEEPMDVSAIEASQKPLREEVHELKTMLKELTRAKKSEKVSTSPSKKTMTCFFCKKQGHIKPECEARKTYWEKKGGQPRPLPPSERKFDQGN